MSNLPENTAVIQKCTVAYPSLTEPTPDLNGVPKFSCVLLIPKGDNIDSLKTALQAAMEIGRAKKWGGTIPEGLHIPLQDGDVYAAKQPSKRGHYVGHYYLNAKQDPEWGQPTVVDGNGLESKSASTIRSGNLVAAVVEFFPYSGVTGKGLSVSPKVVKFLDDGTPIGGGVSKNDAMAALGLDPNAKPAPAADVGGVSIDDLM